MTFTRLAKLVSRYGIYYRYKERRYNTEKVVYFYGDCILIDYNQKLFIGTDDETWNWDDYDGETLYSHQEIDPEDYKKGWVLMRKKDVIKKYGNDKDKKLPTFHDELKDRKQREKAWKKRMKEKHKAEKQKRKETL